jgi:hypothetical protein
LIKKCPFIIPAFSTLNAALGLSDVTFSPGFSPDPRPFTTYGQVTHEGASQNAQNLDRQF